MKLFIHLWLALGMLTFVSCKPRSRTAEAAPAALDTQNAVTATPTSEGAEGGAAKSPPTAQPAPAGPAQSAGAPGVVSVTDKIPTAPPNSSKTNPVDRRLTEALQRYNEAKGKMPDTFQVLVTEKYLKALPTPPAGKRYAIDRPHMQVVVID